MLETSLFPHEFKMPFRFAEWIPAFAGMTLKEQTDKESPNSVTTEITVVAQFAVAAVSDRRKLLKNKSRRSETAATAGK
ncbi:MAG TPA: hypothetical protein VMX16_15485 [Terriglobia bacterium]|nr:hypothetical protein [Terriglobia bacterium]